MKPDVKFLVMIQTYDRNELVNETIRSVFGQSYQNWEVVVSDNASPIPVADTVPAEYQSDRRFKIVRLPETVQGNRHGELILRRALDYDYDYLLVIADDDILTPYALEYVRDNCRGYGLVGGSHLLYFQDKQALEYEEWGNEPIAADALCCIEYNCQSQGINLPGVAAVSGPLVGPTHGSTFYVSRSVLEQALNKYGSVFEPPFGDVIGYSKLAFLAKEWLYLPLPLGVIRIYRNYGTMPGQSGNRFFLLKHHQLEYKYSPLKAVSYANTILESHLKMLNVLSIPFDPRPRTIFFLKHIYEIVQDRPINSATFKDLWEAVACLVRSGLALSVFGELSASRQRRARQAAASRLRTKGDIASILAASSLAEQKYQDFRRTGAGAL